jgi:uncharacterized protein (DUF2141 family)
MDETYSQQDYAAQGTDSWALARLGNIIDVYVDRNLKTPQVIQPTTGYGMTQDGQLYQIGQPAYGQAAPVAGRINPLFVLVAFVAFVALRKG